MSTERVNRMIAELNQPDGSGTLEDLFFETLKKTLRRVPHKAHISVIEVAERDANSVAVESVGKFVVDYFNFAERLAGREPLSKEEEINLKNAVSVRLLVKK